MMKHPTQLSLALDVWRASRGGRASMALRQHQRLLDLVGFARAHSPFYQQHYRQFQGSILENSSREQLHPDNKPDLMAHFDELVTDPAVTRAGVECPCGNPLPTIRVEGRTDEILSLSQDPGGQKHSSYG